MDDSPGKTDFFPGCSPSIISSLSSRSQNTATATQLSTQLSGLTSASTTITTASAIPTVISLSQIAATVEEEHAPLLPNADTLELSDTHMWTADDLSNDVYSLMPLETASKLPQQQISSDIPLMSKAELDSLMNDSGLPEMSDTSDTIDLPSESQPAHTLELSDILQKQQKTESFYDTPTKPKRNAAIVDNISFDLVAENSDYSEKPFSKLPDLMATSTSFTNPHDTIADLQFPQVTKSAISTIAIPFEEPTEKNLATSPNSIENTGISLIMHTEITPTNPTNTSKDDCLASASMPLTQEPEELNVRFLTNWFIIPKAIGPLDQASFCRTEWIVIAGFQSTSCMHKSSNQIWSSSLITDIVDAHTLKTSSGKVYKLIGEMDRHRTLEHGFDETFYSKFRFGFPEHWKLALGLALNEMATQKNLCSVATPKAKGRELTNSPFLTYTSGATSKRPLKRLGNRPLHISASKPAKAIFRDSATKIVPLSDAAQSIKPVLTTGPSTHKISTYHSKAIVESSQNSLLNPSKADGASLTSVNTQLLDARKSDIQNQNGSESSQENNDWLVNDKHCNDTTKSIQKPCSIGMVQATAETKASPVLENTPILCDVASIDATNNVECTKNSAVIDVLDGSASQSEAGRFGGLKKHESFENAITNSVSYSTKLDATYLSDEEDIILIRRSLPRSTPIRNTHSLVISPIVTTDDEDTPVDASADISPVQKPKLLPCTPPTRVKVRAMPSSKYCKPRQKSLPTFPNKTSQSAVKRARIAQKPLSIEHDKEMDELTAPMGCFLWTAKTIEAESEDDNDIEQDTYSLNAEIKPISTTFEMRQTAATESLKRRACVKTTKLSNKSKQRLSLESSSKPKRDCLSADFYTLPEKQTDVSFVESSLTVSGLSKEALNTDAPVESPRQTRSGRTVVKPLAYWKSERKMEVPITDVTGQVKSFRPVIVVGAQSAWNNRTC
ncbi:hypothetical protein BDV3_001113 [Batrachochytrium dendrobatidis]